MADLKISDLPTDIVTLAAGDKFPVADVSALTANTYCTAQEIKDFVDSDISIIRTDTDFTLASSAAIQNLFASPTALTISTGVYKMDGLIYVGSMSGTSGNFKFSITAGGGAVLGSQIIRGSGIDGTGAAAPQTGTWVWGVSETPGNLVSASTSGEAWVEINATFEVTTAGTITPRITLTSSAAAVVKAGTFLKIIRIGDVNLTNKGAWS